MNIWLFTLGYSWQSGANFFKRNLLDFCPASNTLGPGNLPVTGNTLW